LELQSLDSIARDLVDGVGNGQAQGAHGRDPTDACAQGASQVVEGELFIFTKHVAGIVKAINRQ